MENPVTSINNSSSTRKHDGKICVGPQSENQGFAVKFTIQSELKDEILESATIMFIPEDDTLGKHEIASSALFSKVYDKLRDLVPYIIKGVKIDEKSPLLTFDLKGTEALSQINNLNYEEKIKEIFKPILDEIERKLENEFIHYPSGYDG